MVPALNSLDPAVVEKLGKVLTRLTPATYDSLVNILTLGVPGINALAAKLNMLPFAISLPEPQPFVARAAAPAPVAGGRAAGHGLFAMFGR